MTSNEYDAAILDLDGTVYRGDQLIQGADRSVEMLRETVSDVLFLTNKAIERRRDYTEKLRRLGIPVDRDDVVNSGWVTAQYVSDEYPGERAFVVGEVPLIEELSEAGVPTTTDSPGELLVVSMDRDFGYEALELALETLEAETPFLATNPDRTCPTENGAIPDAAGMIGAVEGVTGRTVDEVLGKPSPTMMRTALDIVGATPENCLMVGDRIETDILMGDRAGMTTVLVLSGVTDRSDVPDASVTPDFVLDSLAELASVFEA